MYNAISDNIFINLFLIAIMVKHNSGFFPLVLDLNNFVNIYVRYFFFFLPNKAFQRCNSGDETVKHRVGLVSNLGGLLMLATFY